MNALSRRDLFRSLLGRTREKEPQEVPSVAARDEADLHPATPCSPAMNPATRSGDPCQPQLALILDRFCLAWQGSFCSVCVERCPVPGAIATEMGKPRVSPETCTGCGICHDVCPAPKNAVFLVPRKPGPGMIGRTVAETAPREHA